MLETAAVAPAFRRAFARFQNATLKGGATYSARLTLQMSLNKLIGLGDHFLHFSEGNELIIHGLGTTIPGFIQERHRRAFRSRMRNAGHLMLPCRRARRPPNVRKN